MDDCGKRTDNYGDWKGNVLRIVLACLGKLRNIRQQCYVTQVPAMMPQKLLRDKGNILFFGEIMI